jgi:hypothetical protein
MRDWFTDTGIATKVSSVNQLVPGDVIVTNDYGHVVLYIGSYEDKTHQVASHSAWGIFSYTYFGTPNEYWHITSSSLTDQQKQQEILNIVNSHRGSLPTELVLALTRQEGGEGAFHVDGWNYNDFYRESDGAWAQPTNGDGIMQVTAASGYHENSGPYTHDCTGYDHAINDGCDYLLKLYSTYATQVQSTLHYNTGPNSLYIYLGKSWGNRDYLSHVAEHLSTFVPNTYGLSNQNLVNALNQGQNILDKYLYDMGIATGQSVGYYEPYQTQLDSELHNIEAPNQPPNTPSIPSGPTSGQIGISYPYSTVTTDPNSDNVYYWFDWGDDTNSGWIGPYPSGTSGSASKEWNNPGTYNVKTKAKDEHGAESSPLWSDPLPVCINGLWEDDPSNPCKERRLTCSGTYEYKNKADGTICGHGEWEDDPANQCKERREIQKCVSGTCTPSGEYEYKNKADGGICGHGEWEDDPANQCKERREIQPDGTICGCTASNTLKSCYSGVCSTDTGICDSANCGADAACDGKRPGDSCGGGTCDSNCKCGATGSYGGGIYRNGLWALRTEDSPYAKVYRFGWGRAIDIPVTGDWNDDGTDTIGLYRNGEWILSNSIDTPSRDHTVWWGRATDIPVTGDWNDDGTDTIGLYRDGEWILSDSITTPSRDHNVRWGRATDIPVTGDWNGDGTDTIGLYRDGEWILSNSIDTPSRDHTVWRGRATDKPVTGDWNGDGEDTIGLYRDGEWILSNSITTPSRDHDFWWGLATDIPVTGDWI